MSFSRSDAECGSLLERRSALILDHAQNIPRFGSQAGVFLGEWDQYSE